MPHYHSTSRSGVISVFWTLLTKVETSCDRILIAGGANVEAEWEQGPAVWTLLTKVETSCDRILIAGGANVEAEWEQGPAV